MTSTYRLPTLDEHIAELQAEVDRFPEHLRQTEGFRFRVNLLAAYRAKRERQSQANA